jgi:hypothetical protein
MYGARGPEEAGKGRAANQGRLSLLARQAIFISVIGDGGVRRASKAGGAFKGADGWTAVPLTATLIR